jgi:transglutaminase-like putative cysteine protease
VRVAASSEFKSLGRADDITGAQHCRAEVYLNGYGWMPVDPADVRKVVLEENLPGEQLPLTDPKVKRAREKTIWRLGNELVTVQLRPRHQAAQLQATRNRIFHVPAVGNGQWKAR